MPRSRIWDVRPVKEWTRLCSSWGMRQRSPQVYPHGHNVLRLRQWGVLLALLGLVIGSLIAWPPPSSAQTSQQVNFRISRLETEIRTLQSQLNQLESQIGRGDRPSRVQPASPNFDPENLNDSVLASDPMFDRLATLVIETRQDVFALQERLEALEQQSD